MISPCLLVVLTLHIPQAIEATARDGVRSLQQSAQASATATPGPRRAHALAYDEAHARTILFGGAGSGAGLDTTWAWDGKSWSALRVKGPGERRGCTALFDARRAELVLLGGQAGDAPDSPVFDETWILGARGWTQSSASTPGARSHFAAAYDRRRERVVLVGGFDPATGHDLTDVWEWDGSAWTRLAVPTPGALFAPQMDFDEKSERLTLTATTTPGNKLATWTFDGTSFVEVDRAGPALILSGKSLVTLGPSGGLLAFGGSDGANLSADTWKWDGAHWSAVHASGPPARVGQAMAFDRKRDCVVLYGGEDGHATLDDLWEFAAGAWRRVEPKR